MPPPPGKTGARHSPTPSVQSGDLLNALLIIKDTINTTLLKEHTRLSDLANVLLELEDQIRDAFEQTIRSMKVEVEKRRRKIQPGIKKLQDTLKSLTKSESKIKGCDKGGKNADVKKAKLRIREAQRTIKELGTNDTEYSVSAFVADQITVLCQRLMQVPPKLTMYDTAPTIVDITRGEKSDTDSDDGRKSREETPNHIYAEIDQYQTEDTYLTPKTRRVSPYRKQEDTQTQMKEEISPISLLNVPQSPRLQNVDLFSSDSDSLEEDLKTSQNLPFQLYQPRSRNPVVYDPETREKRQRSRRVDTDNKRKIRSPNTQDNDYQSLDRIHRRTDRRTEEHMRQRSNSNPLTITRSLEYRKHKFGEHHLSPTMISPVERLQAPIDDYVKRMSPSADQVKPAAVVLPVSAPEPDNRSNFVASTTSLNGKQSGIIEPKQKSVRKISPGRNTKHYYRQTPTSPPSARSPVKRYLPTIPRESQDFPDGIEKKSTNALSPHKPIGTDEIDHAMIHQQTRGKAPIDQERRSVERGSSVRNSQSDTDCIDMEELKFRESVRSARKEIIDKLKSRYTYNTKENETLQGDSKVPCYSDFKEKINMHSSIISDAASTEGSQREIKSTRRYSLDAGNRNPFDLHRPYNTFSPISKPSTSGTYTATVVKITPDSGAALTHALNSIHSGSRESIVASNIKKFETEIMKKEVSDFRTSRIPETRTSGTLRRQGQSVRYRSSSEPRTTFTPRLFSHSKPRNGVLSPPRALRPRRDSGISTISGSDRDMEDHSSNGLEQNHVLKVSCTENDLRDLVRNESPSSIRRQWSMRRSQSLNPKIQERNTVTKGPKFIYSGKFQLPSSNDRCQVSAMVALGNGTIVVLDERNFFLHLFDRTFKHTHQHRLYDIPRGCERISDNRIVVGLPYKRSLQFYLVLAPSRLRLEKEVTIPCNSWIIDISFAPPHLHVLCKSGHVHTLNEEGIELSSFTIGMTGNIFIHPNRKRLFLLGERHMAKFDMEGKLVSTDTNIDARSLVFFENRIYFAERQKHRISPLGETVDIPDLIENSIDFPLAICLSGKADILLVSQYEENLDDDTTRTITIYKQNKAR